MALEERRLLATFTVTKTTDDGSEGTLRWAIAQSNAASEPSTVDFAPLFNTHQTITLTQGSSGLVLTNTNWSQTIAGPMVKVRISGDQVVKNVLSVSNQVKSYLINLEITDGYDTDGLAYGGGGLFIGLAALATVTNCNFRHNVAQNAGGSILNMGIATLNGCTISDSEAPSGGGIANSESGTLTMNNCIISECLAAENGGQYSASGGGLFNANVATLTDCVVLLNSASKGAGAYNSTKGTLNMTNCTISGNQTVAAYGGGGFYNSGTLNLEGCIVLMNSAKRGGGVMSNNLTSASALKLTNCLVSGNTASDYGGGVYSASGRTTVLNCTVTGNKAGLDGGGLLAVQHTASLASSTFSDNTAGRYGGGLFNDYCTATITNCTFLNNSAGSDYYGGGLYNEGDTATLENCTFTGNAAAYGGGVYNYYTGTLALQNNIIAGNKASNQSSDAGPDVYATVSSKGGNLIGVVDGGSDDWQSTDLTQGTRDHPLDPRLAPLGNYGGPTQTMALLPGSPAIGAGTTAGAPAEDQRGRPRSGRIDIGAFQSGGFTLTPVAGSTPQSTEVGKAFPRPLAVTVRAINPIEPVDGGVVSYDTEGASYARLSAATAIIANGQASVTAIATDDRGTSTILASTAGDGGAPGRFALTNTEALSLVVTTDRDAIDEFDGLTSLHEAIAHADSRPGPDTITFDRAVFGMRPRTIRLGVGPLVLTDPATTTILGPGARRLTIQGDGRSRVVDVQGGSLALSGLTISGGRADHGGGLRNDGGSLELTGVIIRHNASRGFGGGLLNTGRTRLTRVIVRGNHARVGGGVANFGTLDLNRVAIRYNLARVASGLFNGRAPTWPRR